MNIADISSDPHFAARNMIVSVDQLGDEPIRIAGVPIKTATPGGVHRRAPLLGENTLEQLWQAGLSETDIADLLNQHAAFAAHQEEHSRE
jgi:crotonobetainyl-CoA:carnitine CoA-transferase CaiB-like acyl-CoA transferase